MLTGIGIGPNLGGNPIIAALLVTDIVRAGFTKAQVKQLGLMEKYTAVVPRLVLVVKKIFFGGNS
jgi:hypothetical protein